MTHRHGVGSDCGEDTLRTEKSVPYPQRFILISTRYQRKVTLDGGEVSGAEEGWEDEDEMSKAGETNVEEEIPD